MNFRSSLLAFASLVVLAACATPPARSVDAPPAYDSIPTYPHWAGRPVTWSKLGDIQQWLEGAGPRQYPDFVATAELELAEGRLVLARKEGSGLAAPVLDGRLKASEAGFKAVLARPDVRPALQLRAERGLEQIEGLRGARVVGGSKAPSGTAAQSTSASSRLAIQPRTAWNAANPIGSRLTSVIDGWSRITIHHSAEYSKLLGAPSSGNVAGAIKDIQTYHMREEGYGDIAYHFMIDPAGRIWQGRSLQWQGAHAGGTNNVGNIGICVLGNFNAERPDPRSLTALEDLVDALCERHHIPRSRLYGHRQLRSTECPGDSLMAWVSRYAAGATH